MAAGPSPPSCAHARQAGESACSSPSGNTGSSPRRVSRIVTAAWSKRRMQNSPGPPPTAGPATARHPPPVRRACPRAPAVRGSRPSAHTAPGRGLAVGATWLVVASWLIVKGPAGLPCSAASARPPARFRKPGQYLPEHRAEQVITRREGERRLRAGRPAGQHPVGARGGRTACFHTVVLPIPTSPTMTSSADGAPAVAARKAPISATSASRPTRSGSLVWPCGIANPAAIRSPLPGRRRSLAPHPTETSAQGQIHRRLTLLNR